MPTITLTNTFSWDDWVDQSRLRKYNEENLQLQSELKRGIEALRNPTPAKRPSNATATIHTKKARQSTTTTGGPSSDFSSARGSEERHSSHQPVARAQKRATRDYETEREESFHSRPSVRLNIPDHLKAILVDDWENVTKNLQLVRLPSLHPVNDILATYLKEELPKRVPGSAEADILEEVVMGVREYFEKSLGRILLYRFERDQYFDLRKLWEGADADTDKYKGAGDVYGAEHLCRLFVSMPELVAQTNMDQQSVARLRDELGRLTAWIAKGSGRWFGGGYEEAGNDYVAKAKGE